MGESPVEQPYGSGEEQQHSQKHKSDVAACGCLLAGLGPGDAEGIDECVDYEAKWIHG
jgi:hypothetical protein